MTIPDDDPEIMSRHFSTSTSTYVANTYGSIVVEVKQMLWDEPDGSDSDLCHHVTVWHADELHKRSFLTFFIIEEPSHECGQLPFDEDGDEFPDVETAIVEHIKSALTALIPSVTQIQNTLLWEWAKANPDKPFSEAPAHIRPKA